jgi:DNA helicase-2/ATP-dependent DNA helicase PcrA
MAHRNLERGHRGSVVAPAGYGKTHTIVDIARSARSKPVLILTHTNAGVAALRQRLVIRGVPQAAFRLATLDAWSQRIARSFPMRAQCDPATLETLSYPAIRKAANNVVLSGALDRALEGSYGGVLVDEYQDCSLDQHCMCVALAERLPTRIFGDPMQAVFDFDEPVIAWQTVEAAFPPHAELTKAWRWEQAGAAKLGTWLAQARIALERGQKVDFNDVPTKFITILRAGDVNNEKTALQSIKLGRQERLLIIENSEAVARRQAFARRHPGVCVVERADLPDLTKFGQSLTGAEREELLEVVLDWAEPAMTGVNKSNLLKRVNSICRGAATKLASPHELAACAVRQSPSVESALGLYLFLAEHSKCRVFRPEFYQAMLESLRTIREFSQLNERLAAIQNRRRYQSRPMYRKAIGSTLLLKGLEAQHVLVLDVDRLSARHQYVAMTRGSHTLTVMRPEA